MPGASEDSKGHAPSTSFLPGLPFPVNELTTGPAAGQSFQITLITGLRRRYMWILQACFLGVPLATSMLPRRRRHLHRPTLVLLGAF